MSVDRQGVVKAHNFDEYIIESDGTVFYHVFHHVSPSTGLFRNTDDFANGVYIDENRWFHCNILNELSEWEFLYVQKQTAISAVQKIRWKQSKNPFLATYADVAPGKITNVSSATAGGMYKLASSNLYFCIANSNEGDWFGGIGCSSVWNDGILGYPNNVVTTGSIDLYVKVPYTQAQIRKLDMITVNNFYEI